MFSFFKSHTNINDSILGSVPHTSGLFYPAPLVHFEELVSDDHNDPRALYYAIRHIDPNGKRPFSSDALSGLDFGRNSDALRFLVRHGFVCKTSAARSLVETYSKEELQTFARELGLSTRGTKASIAEALHKNGFHSPDKKRRRRLYELTDAGRTLMECHNTDRSTAIFDAICAIKHSDYSAAISAYRDYDRRWGFVHTSGENHTIFAHYDIPFSRFDFLAQYPMKELRNSVDFKKSLRACLIAGLMRGEQEPIALAYDFQRVFQEQIICPNVVRLFFSDDVDDRSNAIRAAMEQNVSSDNQYALQYYISHVLYLSRRA